MFSLKLDIKPVLQSLILDNKIGLLPTCHNKTQALKKCHPPFLLCVASFMNAPKGTSSIDFTQIDTFSTHTPPPRCHTKMTVNKSLDPLPLLIKHHL